MKYRRIPVVVHADQWWPGKKLSLGDIMMAPRRNDAAVPIAGVCPQCCVKCGGLLNDHGIIEHKGETWLVCPGDIVLLRENGDVGVCASQYFVTEYEPMETEENHGS